jgi:uncharacterized protein DUF6524
MQSSGFTGFLVRWLLSLAVVFSVYNVRGQSLYHVWLTQNEFQLSLKVLSTMLILLALVVIIRATLQAINLVGLIVLTAIVATVVWVLSDYEFVTVTGEALTIYFAQIILATALGLGMTLGKVQRQLG